MALYLGIDGGGTGCRAAVADDTGVVLGRGQSGPANIASDPDTARKNILAATDQALTSAVGAASAPAELSRLRAGLGLAGANAAGAVGRLRLALPFATATIETDAVTTAMGALGGQDGVVAAIGTGSVFAAIRQGHFRQIGGWGLVLGDEGSAAILGRSILSYALRALDGHAEMTPLLAKLLQDHGGPTGVVTFAQSARPSDFAALAPQVTASEDHAADDLMRAATKAVAESVTLLLDGSDLPVVFTGGLGPVYRARLSQTVDWAIKDAAGTALDGALMLAQKAG
jgi:glucosamine kinase